MATESEPPKRAYLIAQINVTDPVRYQDYVGPAKGSAEKYGGRYIVRGAPPEVLEGDAPPRFVVIDFPNIEAARAWYHSPEYQAAAAIRREASTGSLFFIEGC
jgi:uncharacterized protein (DUF1330 family)